jgi:hypothetical protein
MRKIIVATCVALCSFVGAAAAQGQRCAAQDEGALFLEWSDGTPRGVRLVPTGDAWQLTRLSDGIYEVNCPTCGEGRGVSGWFVSGVRDPGTNGLDRLLVPGVTGELALRGGVAIIANILTTGPSPTSIFGLGGQIAAVEVRLRDRRATAMTIMTAIEGCLTLSAILLDATGLGVTTQDAGSFASALAVEWYRPGIDRR